MEPRTVPSNQWESYVERLRVQLPAAPPALLDGYVVWAPWLAIVFGAFGVVVFLGLTMLAAVLAPLAVVFGGAAGVQAGGAALIAAVLSLVIAVLEVVGGVLMLGRRLSGWWLLAVGLVVGLLTNLLSASPFGLVIGLLVAYLHVQVRPRYS